MVAQKKSYTYLLKIETVFFFFINTVLSCLISKLFFLFVLVSSQNYEVFTMKFSLRLDCAYLYYITYRGGATGGQCAPPHYSLEPNFLGPLEVVI